MTRNKLHQCDKTLNGYSQHRFSAFFDKFINRKMYSQMVRYKVIKYS